MSDPNPNAWRRIAAALAHDETRQVYAEIVLAAAGRSAAGESATPTNAARHARALQRLREAGLVDAEGRATGAPFRDLLAADPVVRPTGPERFLDADGRIDRYPQNADERLALLRWVVERALQPGEELDEAGVNARLEPYDPQVATLRRYLVDAELLERTRSGSSYTRVTD